jgi:dihydroxyacetone kinase-like protein
MDQLNNSDLRRILQHVAQAVQNDAQQLNALDAETGDGDMGVTLAAGFREIEAGLAGWQDLNCSELLRQCGLVLADTSAGTIGTLLASAFLSAARVTESKAQLGPDDLAGMLAAAQQAIQDRGKAQVGEKTMLDALAPACRVATESALESTSPAHLLSACAAAAEQGAEATRGLVPVRGRARWFQERAHGRIDPGAYAVARMLRAAADSLQA